MAVQPWYNDPTVGVYRSHLWYALKPPVVRTVYSHHGSSQGKGLKPPSGKGPPYSSRASSIFASAW